MDDTKPDSSKAELTQNTELELELDIDELEERIAPGLRLSNHNETLVAD